jgi:hypothetical protein
MTVKELREKLSEMDENMEVIIADDFEEELALMLIDRVETLDDKSTEFGDKFVSIYVIY